MKPAGDGAARGCKMHSAERGSKDKVQQLRMMCARVCVEGWVEKTHGGMNEVLLTYFTPEVLEEPVQDDTSHQRGRQIHLQKFDRQKGAGMNEETSRGISRGIKAP